MTAPLLVDCYEYDGVKPAQWATLAAAGRPWCGAILKATEGSYFVRPWFRASWAAVRSGGGTRYGVDWFRGAYHYLRVAQSGRTQAHHYLMQIAGSGGWGHGDLWPFVDVEATGNKNATAQQVIDCTSDFAAAILEETGRRPALYGGSFLRGLKIRDRMGCQLLWVPRYSATLPASTYTSMGWDASSLWAWQYCGDGEAFLKGYPKVTPIGSKLDISAIVINGGADPEAMITWTRTHLGVTPT